jgi:NTE family protein
MSKKNDETRPQRALVLQGGGALGAYEAGVFKVLCEHLTKQDEEKGEKDRPLFDIIAGTSIGAINAAILVSHVADRRKANPNITSKESWEGSVEKLVSFWNYLSQPTPNISKLSTEWQKHKNESTAASEEAIRRYYSAKEFLKVGVEKVFSKEDPILDKKFYDNPPNIPNNTWFRYDNQRLRESLEHEYENGKKFIKFPITTDFDKGEPRLLVVSVDVVEGATVTFDSYGKPNTIRKSQYGYNEKAKKYEYTIEYPQGITLKHIMASAAVPGFYDYEEIDGRKFWDGYLLSNTPLRELIEEHKAFWEYKIGPDILRKCVWDIQNGQRVPDLEVYIVNVYPRKEEKIPSDYDGVKERMNDITNSDKTSYEESVVILVTDYLNLIEKLINLGKEDDKLRQRIKNILQEPARSRLYSYLESKERTEYIDILKRKFKIEKIIRIEKTDDVNSVNGKFTDFTSETINNLIKEGEKDAINTLKQA